MFYFSYDSSLCILITVGVCTLIHWYLSQSLKPKFHVETLTRNLRRYLLQQHYCYRCKPVIVLHLYVPQAEDAAELFRQFEFPSLILWPQTYHFGPFYLFHADLQPQQFSVFSVNPIWTITAHAADSKGHHRSEIADVWSLSDDCSQCSMNTTDT